MYFLLDEILLKVALSTTTLTSWVCSLFSIYVCFFGKSYSCNCFLCYRWKNK